MVVFNVVNIYRLNNRGIGVWFLEQYEIFFFSCWKCSGQLRTHPVPSSIGIRSYFFWGCSRRSVKLTTHFYLMLLRIRGTIPPFGARADVFGLGHCATSRKVAGSISDGVIGIFHLRNPSGRTMTLRSTQPLTEYQGYFLGGKGGRRLGLTALLHSCADCLEIWQPQPRGTLRACPGFVLHFRWLATYKEYDCVHQVNRIQNRDRCGILWTR